ncbi:hypothetical protein [Streptomyces sp. NPDC015125]|uniref:hypothetical protein n=1 Tax=Streptomyces sp. NPDC015125 TaxID=3364938 RepID=UPI003703673B
MTPYPKAACYGRGTIFPIVVLDEQLAWHQTAPDAVPVRDVGGEDLLVLRWCGPLAATSCVLDSLHQAATEIQAALAAGTELSDYAPGLPDGLRLIALRPSAVIGPWHSRPGRTTLPT